MRSVLRYPGSKWNIASQLVRLIQEHHTYVEPFFGSGAVLFNKQQSNIEMVNDLDSNVVNLFHCIQEDAQNLARMVMTTPFSREIYEVTYRNAYDNDDSYQKALKFLIQCWQGYGFRTDGSKVGWRNDVQGRERAYALWNWYRLPEWLIDIAERLRMVQIENRPALEVIERFNYSNVFMSIDPPYMLHTRTGKQYNYEMTDSDHEELLKMLLQSKAKIMLSGYESDMYNDYLAGWGKKQFSSYAEHGKPRTETVWINYMHDAQQMSFDDFPEILP
mgnify:FL=1